MRADSKVLATCKSIITVSLLLLATMKADSAAAFDLLKLVTLKDSQCRSVNIVLKNGPFVVDENFKQVEGEIDLGHIEAKPKSYYGKKDNSYIAQNYIYVFLQRSLYSNDIDGYGYIMQVNMAKEVCRDIFLVRYEVSIYDNLNRPGQISFDRPIYFNDEKGNKIFAQKIQRMFGEIKSQ